MALKGDRVEHLTDISFYKSDATAERGVILAHNTGGSGAAMDDALADVDNVSAYTDSPAGLLLNDVVNIDLTRQQYNAHKDEMQLGGKVTLLQVGQVTTDKVTGTIAAGNSAYVGASGLFSATPPADGTTEDENYRVGRFLSSRDSDGYVKVAVNIA